MNNSVNTGRVTRVSVTGVKLRADGASGDAGLGSAPALADALERQLLAAAAGQRIDRTLTPDEAKVVAHRIVGEVLRRSRRGPG
jgi:hypothetical protein